MPIPTRLAVIALPIAALAGCNRPATTAETLERRLTVSGPAKTIDTFLAAHPVVAARRPPAATTVTLTIPAALSTAAAKRLVDDAEAGGLDTDFRSSRTTTTSPSWHADVRVARTSG